MKISKGIGTHLLPTITSFAAAGALLACASTPPGPPLSGTNDNREGVTNTQKGADESVVEHLSAARCDREASCKNIGPGARYVSRDICMHQMRGGIGNDLNAYNCPRGLDSSGVSRCTAAIQGEECGHPFDTLTRIDTCRSGAMCLR